MDWNNHSPWLAGCSLIDAAHDKVCLHCCKGALLECFQVAIHQDLPGCTIGRQTSPLLLCVITASQVQDLTIIFVKPHAGLVGLLFQAVKVSMRWLFPLADPPPHSVVSFVHFAMYKLHVIVWHMNIYPSRMVFGLLTGKGSVDWVNRQHPVGSEKSFIRWYASVSLMLKFHEKWEKEYGIVAKV